MTTKIHGVIGGPRQKISPPRTKVDITNNLIDRLALGEVEAIIVSTEDDEVKVEPLREKENKTNSSESNLDGWLLKLSRQSS